ncbi:MAG: GAF domain-containing protein [Gammaproteobacteria bacterium]|nr:GAF domain-containing protein [Gammaproteobacteria bacterium]
MKTTEGLKIKNLSLSEEENNLQILQQISSRLIEEENVERLYEQIIEVAKAVMHSDAVSMQVYIPEKKALHLLACNGFHSSVLQFWQWMPIEYCNSTYARAMAERKRVVVSDLENCHFLRNTNILEFYRTSGIRSVQSTPLVSRTGEIVGMISNYWKGVHQPSERDFALLDVIIRQAADLLERMRVQAALRENESWLNGQKEAFQAAMSGFPLKISLKALVDTFVLQTQGEARAAFYLVPVGVEGLHHVVGMSDEYAKEVNGFVIGPKSIACGLAMFTGIPVITPDVEEEPLWEPWRSLARRHNYRSCWSFPVRTNQGPVVGTFAVYFSQPRKPLLRELELAAVLSHAAAIIISRDRELLERTQVEEALRKSEKELKKLVRLQDEFIGNASHELNTPLTSIMIYAEILEQHFKEIASPRHTEMMHKLRLQVDRLHLLIRDMLDTTRLVEGKLVLVITHFDLNKLIKEKVEEMQQDTKKHKIIMQLNSIEKIAADEERIEQVITNLISNAIKYSPRGGEIIIASKVEEGWVSVTVTDYGIGIPTHAFEGIFERFYRVNSKEARTFPGVGIGLFICKDIIDMHGGNITVESQEGIGSTFKFIIPINYMKNKNEDNFISRR